MTATAREKLSALSRHYLALRIAVDQEKRMLRFRPDLLEQVTITRNQIVELQNRLIVDRHRKEVV